MREENICASHLTSKTNSEGENQSEQKACVMFIRKTTAIYLAAFVVILISYFGPSAYRKTQADKEVDRLCAMDGGLKVIEKVLLSSDKFDQFGNPLVPLSTSKAAQSSAYVLDASVIEIVKGGSGGSGEPAIHRFTSKAIRVSDKKVLGVAVGYYRFGGEPEGPWHPSSYTGCTEEPGKQINRAVFSRFQ